MKRLAVLAVTLSLLFALSACFDGKPAPSSTAEISQITPLPVGTDAPAKTDAPPETAVAVTEDIEPPETTAPAKITLPVDPLPVTEPPIIVLPEPAETEEVLPAVTVVLPPVVEPPVVEPSAVEPPDEFDFATADLSEYVTLGKYRHLRVQIEPPASVSDNEVEDLLLALLDYLPEEAMISDRPCAEGDRVRIDFVGRIGGALLKNGSATGFAVTLGSGTLTPGLEEAICGMTVGETKTIPVKFPSGYYVALAEMAADFDVTLTAIYPALDDALVQTYFEAEDLSALRTSVRERLAAQTEETFAETKCDALWTALLAGATVHRYPESALEAAFEANVTYYERKAVEYDLSYAELFPMVYGISVDTAEEIMMQGAMTSVAQQLVVYAIAKEQGLPLDGSVELYGAVTDLVMQNASFTSRLSD